MIAKIDHLVRENIRFLVPYSSARNEYSGSDAVLMDANENPFNHPYNRYPDPMQMALKERISELKEIPEEMIFLGNGSDEAIDNLYRVFCEPGKDHVLSIEPTYGMYQVCADINNIAVRKIPLNPDYSLDISSILEAVNDHTKLIFICSPNNPTSNSFPAKDILEVVTESDALVVLDEAYIDFSASESMLGAVMEFPNLVILQTFSKAWGMAGIRLGMAIAQPEVMTYMNRVKYPYNVNRLTLEHALEALKQPEKKDRWVEMILNERNKLAERLGSYPYVEEVYPSDANFLLVRVQNPTALYDYLKSNGMIVRDRSRVPLCEGALRITVGTEQENQQLIGLLDRFSLQSQ